MVTVQEIQEALASDTPEIKAFKSELTKGSINLETVKGYLENDTEGKKYFSSTIDSAISKGVDAFKTKSLPKLVEDEIAKRNPAMTEEQKQLAQLKSDFEKIQNEAKREKLLNSALKYANDKNLPTQFLDRFLGNDETETLKNLDDFSTIFNEAVKNSVEGKFKSNGREVQGNESKTSTLVSSMTPEQIAKIMSDPVEYAKHKTEINAYINKNS